MTDAIENMLLEHLKRFQAGQERIEAKLDEALRRLSNLEAGQSTLTASVSHLQAVDAQHQL